MVYNKVYTKALHVEALENYVLTDLHTVCNKCPTFYWQAKGVCFTNGGCAVCSVFAGIVDGGISVLIEVGVCPCVYYGLVKGNKSQAVTKSLQAIKQWKQDVLFRKF